MHTLDANGTPIPCSDALIPAQFRMDDEGVKETFQFFGKDSNSSSDNKIVLIVALILCILVAIGGGYLIYRHIQHKKTTESFGYKL